MKRPPEALQFGFKEHNGVLTPDTLMARLNGEIPKILLHDSLWRGIPDTQKAVFIDKDEGYWVEHHPRIMNIMRDGIDIIPIGERNLGGIAVITRPLQESTKLQEYLETLGEKLGEMGVLLIIESGKPVNGDFWREQLLDNAGFVENKIYPIGEYSIWHGRKRKTTVRTEKDYIKAYTNAEELWKRNFFPLGFAKIFAYYESLGYRVENFDAIEDLWRRTKVFIFTKSIFESMSGVRVLDRRCGVCEYDVTTKGDFKQVKDCHARGGHSNLSASDLYKQRVLFERISAVRQVLKFDRAQQPSRVLERVCFDCPSGNSAITQTAVELGMSPVGLLYYITRTCSHGHYDERQIGVVE